VHTYRQFCRTSSIIHNWRQTKVKWKSRKKNWNHLCALLLKIQTNLISSSFAAFIHAEMLCYLSLCMKLNFNAIMCLANRQKSLFLWKKNVSGEKDTIWVSGFLFSTNLPHRIERLVRSRRVKEKLKLWWWKNQMNKQFFLARGGNFRVLWKTKKPFFPFLYFPKIMLIQFREVPAAE
jgi:hypothetical protein